MRKEARYEFAAGLGRIVRPPAPEEAERAVARSGSNNGTEKWNREPTPTSLSTHIRPPCTSTRCLAIARPRPVPPASRERAASTR